MSWWCEGYPGLHILFRDQSLEETKIFLRETVYEICHHSLFVKACIRTNPSWHKVNFSFFKAPFRLNLCFEETKDKRKSKEEKNINQSHRIAPSTKPWYDDFLIWYHLNDSQGRAPQVFFTILSSMADNNYPGLTCHQWRQAARGIGLSSFTAAALGAWLTVSPYNHLASHLYGRSHCCQQNQHITRLAFDRDKPGNLDFRLWFMDFGLLLWGWLRVTNYTTHYH